MDLRPASKRHRLTRLFAHYDVVCAVLPQFLIVALIVSTLILPVLPARAQDSADSSEATPFRFEQLATIDTSKGYVSEAAWAGSSMFFSLVLTPEGAEVWRTDYDFPLPEKFISAGFMAKHICPPQYASGLRMTVSPTKNFIAFMWREGDKWEWRLLDVSSAPTFYFKRFVPPEGMKISSIAVSPDDHYAVFVHDAFEQGSPVSLLVMDLRQGKEYWRITGNELSFIRDLWWGNIVQEGNRAFCTAKLIDGEFADEHRLVVLDLDFRTITTSGPDRDTMTGASSIWGSCLCYASENEEMPWLLSMTMPGSFEGRQVPLSSVPAKVNLLAEPGLAVICNSDDGSTAALWLIDATTGDKRLIDSDCAGYDAGHGGMLLVRSASNAQLLVYGLTDQPEPLRPPPPPPDSGESITIEFDPGG